MGLEKMHPALVPDGNQGEKHPDNYRNSQKLFSLVQSLLETLRIQADTRSHFKRSILTITSISVVTTGTKVALMVAVTASKKDKPITESKLSWP